MDQPENPDAAGVPRTKGPTRVYEGDGIAVRWDAGRCIHVGSCLRALPAVFDMRRRPWVEIDAASAEEVAAAVRTCPTGALRYESRGELPEEVPDQPTTIEVRPNGPLFVRGALEVLDPAGRVLTEEPRLALCRCGASENKPYCDNSHRAVRFRG